MFRFIAQVAIQKTVNRARRLANKFTMLCRRIGGRPHISETENTYNVTCILPIEAHVNIRAQRDEGILMELESLKGPVWAWEVWIERFKNNEIPATRNIVAVTNGGKITSTNITISSNPVKDEGLVTGYFKKLEFRIGKDFERLSIYLE